MDIKNIEELKALKKTKKPYLLEFYTDWCLPCKSTQKIIKTQSANLPGAINIARVNCDYAEDLVIDYQIQNVPTIIVLDHQFNLKAKFVGNIQQKVRKIVNYAQQLKIKSNN